MVISNVVNFHPYLGKWSNLTKIFQMAWNHQLVLDIESDPQKVSQLCWKFVSRSWTTFSPIIMIQWNMPMRSMGLVYLPTFTIRKGKTTVHVGKYTNPMDLSGLYDENMKCNLQLLPAVTFWSPKWRSLISWKDHLNHLWTEEPGENRQWVEATGAIPFSSSMLMVRPCHWERNGLSHLSWRGGTV